MGYCTFYHSYSIRDNKIDSVDILDISASSLDASVKYYVVFSYNDGPIKVLDVNKYVSGSFNVDYTLSVRNIIVSNITAIQVSVLPDKIDFIKKSVYCFDPQTVGDFEIWFGDCSDPMSSKSIPIKKLISRDIIMQPSSTIANTDSLVAINGVFHRTLPLQDNMVGVLDGYTNIKRSSRTDMVFVDTTPLGGHDIIPLTEKSFTNINLNKNKIYINSSVSLDNSTILLVIDGTLYTPVHGLYTVIDSTTIVLERNKLDHITPFRHNPNIRAHSKNSHNVEVTNPLYPTLSNDSDFSLFVDSTVSSKTMMMTNEFLLRRLSSTQSFIIKINNSNVFFKTYDLNNFKDTCKYEYFGDEDPCGLFYYNHYHVIPYTVLKNKKPVVSNPDNSLYKTMFQNTFNFYVRPYKGADDLPLTTDTDCIPNLFTDHSDGLGHPLGYLLDISTYSKV